MAKRLWDKGESLNKAVHTFTVGKDPELDLELLRWDILASAAHARMLAEIDVLSPEDLSALIPALAEALSLSDSGAFSIPAELEDGHTALESFLVEKTGEPGKKIHTGRSRNDQVLCAQRLYIRQHTALLLDELSKCCRSLVTQIDSHGSLPMPGYTHMQPAMPSSVGMWLHAFLEFGLELIGDGLALLERVDACPLGAASGFGVPLPLNRQRTADLLGFARVQRSCIDVQNSRGRHELKMLRWLSDIAWAVEKFSWDLILYSSKEFGFFSLPAELTTGSSIMPQKRNPDVLELLRANAAKVRASEQELLLVVAKLPSNYHRDFQSSKEPLLRASAQIREILPIFDTVLSSLSPNPATLEAAMSDELYATYEAYRLVKEGQSFREAYGTAAARMAEGHVTRSNLDGEFALIASQSAAELKTAIAELDKSEQEIVAHLKTTAEIEASLLANP